MLFLRNQNMHIIYHTFFGKLGLAEQVVISENHSYVLSQVYKRHPIGKNKACLPCVPCLPASSLHLPAKRLPAHFCFVCLCLPCPCHMLPPQDKNKPPTVSNPSHPPQKQNKKNSSKSKPRKYYVAGPYRHPGKVTILK